MTAVAALPLAPPSDPLPREERWAEAPASQQAISVALTMLCGVLLVLLINLTGVSQLQHAATQVTLYQQLRLTLAQGATPVAPVTRSGAVVPLGTPIALMTAPAIGLAHEVVVEGSGSTQTMEGVGHRRDTVLPCQVGSSVLMARSGAYGGVGSAWSRLQNGDRFSVTMGQGTCTYQVTGHRLAGDRAPAPPTGRGGSLTLVTATGFPFWPTGVLRVDAALVSDSFDRSDVAFPAGALPASEEPMGYDSGQLFPLTMLAEACVAIAIAGTWLWRRWNRTKTWITIAPLAVGVLFLTAQSLNDLLPNLV